jgi:hypothetical protein
MASRATITHTCLSRHDTLGGMLLDTGLSSSYSWCKHAVLSGEAMESACIAFGADDSFHPVADERSRVCKLRPHP